MIQIEKNAPVMLLIFDGFGYKSETEGNAIAAADMPTYRSLLASYPHVLLEAAGRAVGLPDGFMGNSEVGHLTMGAGRPIRTSLCKFHDAIDDKSIFQNELLLKKFKELAQAKKPLHLMGLLSDAGVHSHEKHLYAMLEMAKRAGVCLAYVHAFLDGRDVLPQSASEYLERLERFCSDLQFGELASLHGRFYAMDRDKNWERTEKSYEVLCGKTEPVDAAGVSWRTVLDESYAQGVTDEFCVPTLLRAEGSIKEGDGVFFFNFRPDRARQLSRCFLDPSRDSFFWLAFFLSTTCYDEKFISFANDVLFEDEKISHTLLDEIAEQTGEPVFLIAETEKYAHVTYFFRGKVDVTLPHETRVLVPSVKAKSYVDHPCMSAETITAKLVESLQHESARFYLVNYANCDMVGHSGNFDATVAACQCLDRQLRILYDEVVVRLGGTIVLTGDHGNAEEMIDLQTGIRKTSHTANPVPFVMINKSLKGDYVDFNQTDAVVRQGLSSVAPTLLCHLGLNVPQEMDDLVNFTSFQK